jgi:hypothetical protein
MQTSSLRSYDVAPLCLELGGGSTLCLALPIAPPCLLVDVPPPPWDRVVAWTDAPPQLLTCPSWPTRMASTALFRVPCDNCLMTRKKRSLAPSQHLVTPPGTDAATGWSRIYSPAPSSASLVSLFLSLPAHLTHPTPPQLAPLPLLRPLPTLILLPLRPLPPP